MRGAAAPGSHQDLVLSVFWIWAILVGLSAFPRRHDVEHLLICLFTICTSSLVRCLLITLAYFFNQVFLLLFYCWVLRVLCIFGVTVLYQMCLLQIFSLSMGLFSYSFDSLLWVFNFSSYTFQLQSFQSFLKNKFYSLIFYLMSYCQHVCVPSHSVTSDSVWPHGL